MIIKTKTEYNKSLIVGRNGEFNIKELQITERNDKIFIDGIGVSGKIIRGGLMVTKECFESMMKQYWTGVK